MTKIECYQKLSEIQSRGISIVDQTVLLAKSEEVPVSVLKFIEQHTKTEAQKFFETLRKLHNEKNHKLYPNILNESLDEVGKLKCLSSYITSVCITMESMDDYDRCIELRKSVGLEVVSEALFDYFSGKDYNSIDKALEYLRSKVRS